MPSDNDTSHNQASESTTPVHAAQTLPQQGSEGSSHPGPSANLKKNCASGPSSLLIHEELGRGGLARVHRGWQPALERDVAVKIPRDDLPRPGLIQDAMLEEARITARLEHPGIPSIHDLQWNENGIPMLAMRRFDGFLLSHRYQDLSRRENAGIVMRVAQTVAYAHQQGVLHRDIKPSNIMLGDFGEVILLDWGMALLIAEIPLREDRWANGACGTPQFIAPEAAAGCAPSIATDIYGLGALLWFAIHGKAPHPAESPKKALWQAIHQAVRPLGDPGTDDLLAVALRALAMEPRDRHANASEFIEALQQAFSREDARRLILEAEQDLDRAASEGYPALQQALFRLQESQRFWPDNPQISRRLHEAECSYAQRALENKDYDLALSLLREDCPQHQALLRKVRFQQRARQLEEEEARRQEERLYYEQERTTFTQLFLMKVLHEASIERQGPDVRLADALKASLQIVEDEHPADPIHRAYVRNAVLVTLREKHFVDLRRPLVHALLTDVQSAGLEWNHELYRSALYQEGCLLRDEELFHEAFTIASRNLHACIQAGLELNEEHAYAADLVLDCAMNAGLVEQAQDLLQDSILPLIHDQPLESRWRNYLEERFFGYLVRVGNLKEAEKMGLSLLQRASLADNNEASKLLPPTMNLAYLYMDQGRWQEALVHMQAARSYRQQIFGPQNAAVYAIDSLIGAIYLGLDDLESAKILHESLNKLRADQHLKPRDYLEPLLRVARWQQRRGHLEQAKCLLEEAYSILPTCSSEVQQWIEPLVQLVLGWCLRSEGQFDKAVHNTEKAAQDIEQTLGKGDGRCRRLRVALADHWLAWQQSTPSVALAWQHDNADRDLLQRALSDLQAFPDLRFA